MGEIINNNGVLGFILIMAVIFGYMFAVFGCWYLKDNGINKVLRVIGSILFWLMVSPWIVLLVGAGVSLILGLVGIPVEAFGVLLSFVLGLFN